MNKRQHRRNRYRIKAKLRHLDELASARIKRNYMASSTTWGASRCPDCGIQVRPHWFYYPGEGRIVDKDGKVVGFISMGVAPPCERAKACKGENPDWEMKSADRYERRLRKGLVKL